MLFPSLAFCAASNRRDISLHIPKECETKEAFLTKKNTHPYWTSEDYAAADIMTVENATGSFAMEIKSNGDYWGQVSRIPAKNLDDTYYVAGIYTDTEGNTYCTGIIAYSLSKYCMNNAKEGKTMQELASATAMYGYYAKAYFN